ncbi:MAG: HupE/UreJ family protein [Niabella sp.]
MEEFSFYFVEGWQHIISNDALDHQLFILALAVIYTFSDWKKVLILVTAFTIGHSLTLALSVLDVFRIPSNWVEFLIPLTIVFTAAWNIFAASHKKMGTNYWLALCFGLVHGMGFANTIRMMLASDESLVTGLLGFNIGLEVGQVCVVFIILLFTKLVTDLVKIPRKPYIRVVSGIVLVISAVMAWQRIPFFS